MSSRIRASPAAYYFPFAEVDLDDPPAHTGAQALAADGVDHLRGRGGWADAAGSADDEVRLRQGCPGECGSQECNQQQERPMDDPRRASLQGLVKLGAFEEVHELHRVRHDIRLPQRLCRCRCGESRSHVRHAIAHVGDRS